MSLLKTLKEIQIARDVLELTDEQKAELDRKERFVLDRIHDEREAK